MRSFSLSKWFASVTFPSLFFAKNLDFFGVFGQISLSLVVAIGSLSDQKSFKSHRKSQEILVLFFMAGRKTSSDSSDRSARNVFLLPKIFEIPCASRVFELIGFVFLRVAINVFLGESLRFRLFT